MKKKVLYIIGGALLILIITNPTYKDFKEYLWLNNRAHARRINNFFFCSIYLAPGGTYLGIAGNFFKTKEPATPEMPIINIDSLRLHIDSVKR
jgi:hypothetical protein